MGGLGRARRRGSIGLAVPACPAQCPRPANEGLRPPDARPTKDVGLNQSRALADINI
jgi:hypothetical protein